MAGRSAAPAGSCGVGIRRARSSWTARDPRCALTLGALRTSRAACQRSSAQSPGCVSRQPSSTAIALRHDGRPFAFQATIARFGTTSYRPDEPAAGGHNRTRSRDLRGRIRTCADKPPTPTGRTPGPFARDVRHPTFSGAQAGRGVAMPAAPYASPVRVRPRDEQYPRRLDVELPPPPQQVCQRQMTARCCPFGPAHSELKAPIKIGTPKKSQQQGDGLPAKQVHRAAFVGPTAACGTCKGYVGRAKTRR